MITEIKSTYDNYNQAVDRDSNADGSEADADLTSNVSSVQDPHKEPPKARHGKSGEKGAKKRRRCNSLINRFGKTTAK